jgi:hypothetical protein
MALLHPAISSTLAHRMFQRGVFGENAARRVDKV